MKSLVYAVTGANGQIGSYLVDFLRKQGHTVYELVRSVEKVSDVRFFKAFDLTHPDMPSLQGVDVLVHTAYFFDTSKKEYEAINIHGTEGLFRRAAHDGVKNAIFISTLSAHQAACSRYGRTKYQLELSLKQSFTNVTVIRPGLVFTSPLRGITAAMDTFVQKLPVVPLIGSGKQLIYPCHLNELARLIAGLGDQPYKNAKPIIAAAEQAVTFRELVQYLAKQRQRKVMLLPIPFFSLLLLLKTVEFCKLSIGLRSDSLLGLQYADPQVDFSETRAVGAVFSSLQ